MKITVERAPLYADAGPRIVEIPEQEAYDCPGIYRLLELVFRYGQNDVQPQQKPSVSVGDVAILTDGTRWLCEPYGWAHLDEGIKEEGTA